MKKALPYDVGQRIRRQRRLLNMTQSALAAELGVSQSAISAMEIGDAQPSLDFLIWFAEKTNTSVEYLVTGKGPETEARLQTPESSEALKKVVADVVAYLAREKKKGGGEVTEALHAYGTAPFSLTEKEIRLVTALRQLDEKRQNRIVEFAEDLARAFGETSEGKTTD